MNLRIPYFSILHHRIQDTNIHALHHTPTSTQEFVYKWFPSDVGCLLYIFSQFSFSSLAVSQLHQSLYVHIVHPVPLFIRTHSMAFATPSLSILSPPCISACPAGQSISQLISMYTRMKWSWNDCEMIVKWSSLKTRTLSHMFFMFPTELWKMLVIVLRMGWANSWKPIS